jgi:hypothetical protein
MKILITEHQRKSIQEKLQSMVKEYGWEQTAKVVNGSDNLKKLGFNNDPMEFLHLFDDLDFVQSKENPYLTLFRYEKGNNMMIYDRKNDEVYINYDVIWSLLEDVFDLKYVEIQELTQEWLSETYNLRGITTHRDEVGGDLVLVEVYNLKNYNIYQYEKNNKTYRNRFNKDS